MLVVNTASQCGHTDQLGGLQSLYEKYKDQGLVVLGFPSNDFRQENLEGEAIANFCKRNYGVSFPMFQKTSVNGPERHPLYVHLVTNSTTPSENIKWNFEKFLVNREGKVIGRYESKVKPDDKKLLSDIESALGTKKSPTL
jgi:glutathione peroxidase